VTKSFRERKPFTEVALTEPGRKAFADYLHALRKLTGKGG